MCEEEREQYEVFEAQTEGLIAEVDELNQAYMDQQQLLQQERSVQTSLQAKLDALSALQAKVQVDGLLQPWLEQKGLASLEGLWQKISVWIFI